MCLVLRDAPNALTVREITEIVTQDYAILGRPGKAISDSLRWEVRRGRVRLLRRGLYAFGFMRRSTEFYMRQRVEALRDLSLVAVTSTRRDTDVAFHR